MIMNDKTGNRIKGFFSQQTVVMICIVIVALGNQQLQTAP